MLLQFPPGLRFAVSAQVSRRRAERHPVLAQRSRDQSAAVRQRADAHREIEALLDQIDGPVAEGQLQIEVRVRLRDADQDRRDAQMAEQRRHRHAQPPFHLPLAGFEQRLAGLDLVHRTQAMLVEQRTLVGQALAARRSVKQHDAEPFLEARDAFADGRARDVQLLGGLREAARFHRGDEHVDAFQVVSHPIGDKYATQCVDLIAFGDKK